VSSLIFELSVIFKLGVRHKNSLLLKAHLKWVKNVDLNLHFNKPKLVSLSLGTGAEEDISFEGLTCPVYFFQPSFYLTPKAFGEHCLIGRNELQRSVAFFIPSLIKPYTKTVLLIPK
jgi:hypothetical protein